MNDFYLYRHAWISAPHYDCQLTDNQCDELLKEGGWMVRNTYDFDQKEESDFWYIIKDSFGGMAELSRKDRKSVRKALEGCDYKIIDKQLVENQGYSIVQKAYDKYVVKNRKMTEKVFQSLLKDWDARNHDFWGIFDLADGSFIGFSVVRIFDSGCFYDTAWILPDYKYNNSCVYYGMYYKHNEYYLVEKSYKYVTDGSRSITDHSNIQPFLEQKFNFRKAYCKLKIRYKWWFGIIVRMLLPFRNIISNRNVKAVLNMHRYQSH